MKYNEWSHEKLLKRYKLFIRYLDRIIIEGDRETTGKERWRAANRMYRHAWDALHH